MLSGHYEELWSGSELGTGGSGDYICQLTFHCYLCQNLDGDGQYSGFASCVTTVDSLPILHTSTSGSLVFFCVSSTFSGCAELRAVSPQLFVHFPFPCPRSLSSLPLSRFLGLKDLHPQFCPGCVSWSVYIITCPRNLMVISFKREKTLYTYAGIAKYLYRAILDIMQFLKKICNIH